MLQKSTKILSQPFPYDLDIKRKCWIILGIGLFIVIFVRISGLADREGINNIFIISGFGLITILVLTINWIILPLLMPRFFHEDKWNVIKEIFFHMWNIFLIGLVNLLYANWGGYYPITISAFVQAQTTTVLIGIFPVTFIVMLKQIWLLKKYMKSASALNDALQSTDFLSEMEKNLNQPITLSSESGRDRIEIRLGDLLFVKSVENYVEVYWDAAQGIQKNLLRSSLKRIEEDLNSYSSVFRCHRTYLINMKNIDRITGNSQGYRLVLKGIEDSIPVSRSYSKTLRALLA